jgi:hypothetical protein
VERCLELMLRWSAPGRSVAMRGRLSGGSTGAAAPVSAETSSGMGTADLVGGGLVLIGDLVRPLSIWREGEARARTVNQYATVSAAPQLLLW